VYLWGWCDWWEAAKLPTLAVTLAMTLAGRVASLTTQRALHLSSAEPGISPLLLGQLCVAGRKLVLTYVVAAVISLTAVADLLSAAKRLRADHGS